MSDPPKRHESAEITVVSSRSVVPGPTIQMIDEIERHRRDAQNDVETLVACPCCEKCKVCFGRGMVSAERSCEYKRVATLTACVPVDDEPPPEAA